MRGFLERLQNGPLLGDGAMGTLLYSRGVGIEQCLEALVLERPELIASIHEDYARAGADVITTHTFGANRMRLAYHGMGELACKFNIEAVRLAQGVRAATGRDFTIAGNIGPVGQRVAWEDDLQSVAIADAFREQISALAEAGVDLLLFETFSDVRELEVVVKLAKSICALPIVASMSYGAEGLTLAGQAAGEVTRRLLAAGADMMGVNCSVGPAQVAEILSVMRDAAPQAEFSVSPNAGLPERNGDGEMCYPVDPQTFASYVARFLSLGVRWVGGCCGTTPDYIAAMRNVLDG